MKILFLDDMQSRWTKFQQSIGVTTHDIVWAQSAQEARSQLENVQFDVAFLDHDLSDSHYAGEHGHEEDGTDVAKFICGLTVRPRLVVVHSMNYSGATRMRAMLEDAGVPCHQMPFGGQLWKNNIGRLIST